MPYSGSKYTPDERAGKTGHIPIERLLASDDEIKDLRVVTPNPNIPWVDIDSDGDHFEKFVAVDSGPAKVVASNWPWQALSTFNVTCLKLDRDILLDPYPFQDPQKQAEYINKNSTRVSAIIPTRNVIKQGLSFPETFRYMIWKVFQSHPDILATLRWLLFQDTESVTTRCPSCPTQITLTESTSITKCSNCDETVYISDFLTLHNDLAESAARETAISGLMSNIEVLLLFSKVKLLWESDKTLLSDHLFIKDGPLYFQVPFNKLIIPIRKFLEKAAKNGTPVCMVGQEKSGSFVKYLDMIKSDASKHSYLILDDTFIHSQVHEMKKWEHLYGKFTYFGGKVFVNRNYKNLH